MMIPESAKKWLAVWSSNLISIDCAALELLAVDLHSLIGAFSFSTVQYLNAFPKVDSSNLLALFDEGARNCKRGLKLERMPPKKFSP